MPSPARTSIALWETRKSAVPPKGPFDSCFPREGSPAVWLLLALVMLCSFRLSYRSQDLGLSRGVTNGPLALIFFIFAKVAHTGTDFANMDPSGLPTIDVDNDGSGGPQGEIAELTSIVEICQRM